MRTVTLFCSALLAVTALYASPQDAQLRIIKLTPYAFGVPGAILGLGVDGLEEKPTSTSPDPSLRIQIVQGGVRHPARIWRVLPTGSGPSSDKSYRSVLFTIPVGLYEGEASVILLYGQKESNELPLKIESKPRTPVVAFEQSMALPPGSRLAPPPAEPKIGRQEEVALKVAPLVDPEEVPDAAVLITFRQGAFTYEVVGRVIHEGDRFPTPRSFSEARDEVRVRVPEDLAFGTAELLVQVRLNGQTSDPAKQTVTIVDARRGFDFPEGVRPRIEALTPKKAGIGQSIALSVDARRSLEPDSSRTLVVIEQGSKRYSLRPELNSALLTEKMPPNMPVLLTARPGSDLIGPVLVRVLNPYYPNETGLSDGVQLEVVNEVIPPEIIEVREATDEDLEPLRRMYASALKTGHGFRHYDPNSRYVAIRAIGLDPNKYFVRIEFEQEAQVFTLTYSDFSSTKGDLSIVRLPEAIKPGPVRAIIRNRAGDVHSVPVTREFEVTRPK